MTEEIKQNLASAYKIIAYLGLDDHTYTHLSARTEDKNAFYIYPFGLRFAEVTADKLIKVSLDGQVLVGKEAHYNSTGFVIHGNIYKARPDIEAIFHLHTPAQIAVSSLKEGLLPISQWALHFYERVAYHEYGSLALEHAQGEQLAKDLGRYMTMLLRNHGAITCGQTIHEALFYTYHLELACKTQCMALAMNRELTMPSHEICQQSVRDLLSFEKDLGLRDWQAWIRVI